MTIERFLPTEPLRPFVNAFLIIDSEQGTINRILPNTGIVLALRCRGSVCYANERGTLPATAITGLRNTTRLIDYAKETTMLLVILKAGAAGALFREPLHELFGISTSLDLFFHRSCVSELEEQVAEVTDNQQRVSLVEHFLLSRFIQPPEDKLVSEALRRIELAKGTIRIKELLASLPISQDPFEKRFRRVVGTSPKQFSDIVRLRTLIQQYSPEQHLTEAAYRAGYFDQAHFIKDFKTFTG